MKEGWNARMEEDERDEGGATEPPPSPPRIMEMTHDCRGRSSRSAGELCRSVNRVTRFGFASPSVAFAANAAAAHFPESPRFILPRARHHHRPPPFIHPCVSDRGDSAGEWVGGGARVVILQPRAHSAKLGSFSSRAAISAARMCAFTVPGRNRAAKGSKAPRTRL